MPAVMRKLIALANAVLWQNRLRTPRNSAQTTAKSLMDETEDTSGPSRGLMEIEDLMRSYALRGVQEWVDSKVSLGQTVVERILGARIANSEELALAAVLAPGGDEGNDFIPVPALNLKDIQWAFFKPLQDAKNQQWTFDLVLLLPERQASPSATTTPRYVGFRLEPAHEGRRHAYGHVQLSAGFGGRRRRVKPEEPSDWLPTSIPAFPVPGTCSLDRFLMLIVALHGFPRRTTGVLTDLYAERPARMQEYIQRVKSLLS